MSVATQFVAPDYDPFVEPDADTGYGSQFDSDTAPCSAPVRRAHLRAVPLAVPPRGVPARRRSAAPRAPRRDTAGSAAGSVAVLLAPEPERAPLRLTRRGVVVLALLVAAVGAALVWVAALSAPAESASGGAAGGPAAAVVTVQSGDTLWSIASRVAPDTDPRAEVEHLRRLNDLDSVALVPGQQLHVR